MRSRSATSWGRLGVIAALFAGAWTFWPSPWLYPLRILTSLLHEFGHGAACLLTGGDVNGVVIDPSGSGRCLIQGGSYAVSLTCGYLGSIAAGCGLILAASRARFKGRVSVGLGFALCAATLAFVTTKTGLTYGMGAGTFLMLSGWKLSEDLNDLILTFLGTVTCMYALLDMRYMFVTGMETDAVLFSKYILPLPSPVWAGLWSLGAAVCLKQTLATAVRWGEKRPLIEG
ncbi:MAG: M50 family metallopeptidase [Elusimicrobia bacterium]|nr:M50 family metallopeptidase [Elusimicrobiota bacterium]